MRFAQLERSLHGVGVERIEHALDAFAAEVPGLGVELDVVRIRDLLYEYYYLHAHFTPIQPEMTMRWTSLVPS